MTNIKVYDVKLLKRDFLNPTVRQRLIAEGKYRKEYIDAILAITEDCGEFVKVNNKWLKLYRRRVRGIDEVLLELQAEERNMHIRTDFSKVKLEFSLNEG